MPSLATWPAHDVTGSPRSAEQRGHTRILGWCREVRRWAGTSAATPPAAAQAAVWALALVGVMAAAMAAAGAPVAVLPAPVVAGRRPWRWFGVRRSRPRLRVRERGAASPPTAQPTAPWAGRCSTTVSEEGMNTLS